MNHLLFPTDFSDTSREALAYALSFARSTGANVTLMHAYQATASPRRPFLENGHSYRQQMIRQLKEFAGSCSCRKETGLRYAAWEGTPARVITEASKTGIFDMIVMGRNRQYDWLTRLMGSITTTISKEAYCPVLIIPPNLTFGIIRRVLVLYVSDRGPDNYISGYLDRIGPEGVMEQYFLPMYTPEGTPSGQRTENAFGRVGEWRSVSSLDDYIHRHRIDLCVVSSNGSNPGRLLVRPSQTLRLLLDSKVPVMAFPPNAIPKGVQKGSRAFPRRDQAAGLALGM